MSAQSGLSRAIKQNSEGTRNYSQQHSGAHDLQNHESNRGQKDVIIRKNSSKKFTNLPHQQQDDYAMNKKAAEKTPSHYRNKTQVVKKNIVNLQQATDNSLASPNNQRQQKQYQQQANHLINSTSDSTHLANSDAANNASLAQKRMRSHMSNQAAMNAIKQ